MVRTSTRSNAGEVVKRGGQGVWVIKLFRSEMVERRVGFKPTLKLEGTIVSIGEGGKANMTDFLVLEHLRPAVEVGFKIGKRETVEVSHSI